MIDPDLVTEAETYVGQVRSGVVLSVNNLAAFIETLVAKIEAEAGRADRMHEDIEAALQAIEIREFTDANQILRRAILDTSALAGGGGDGQPLLASGAAVAAPAASAASDRDPRDWQLALANVRDGIWELFEYGEEEERVRLLVTSQLRQVIDDREETR